MSKRQSHNLTLTALAGAFAMSGIASGQWVEFVDETEERLVAADSLGINDDTERHYAWGDVNKNGWIDLAVARKSPFTTTGHYPNVLFMNEGGILVDRTEEYASAAVVDGHNDQGFLTPTNDRRILMVDVDDNGWLDMVTATTLSFGNPKHIAYPRVYVNQGNDGSGEWQGFVFEDDRIPQFEGNATNGMPHAPRFCGLAAGDVTGNGLPDLYFADYDFGNDGGNFDFNDRLLVNQGGGYFEDESHRIPSNWLTSTFGTAAHIVDINGNGVNDIVRSHSFGCYCVTIIYNDPNNEGHFVDEQNFNSPYFVNVADLNNNGLMDLVVVTDGSDSVHWNQGNAPSGMVNWSSQTLPGSAGVDGNKVTLADLNNNGYTDFLVAGNDPDFSGCRTGYMWRNNQGASFSNDFANLSPTVFNGSYHIAAFDITGNGWQDLVVGKCSGTQVLINQPPFGMSFDYPLGRPELVSPVETTELVVNVSAFGGDLDAVDLYVSMDNGETFTPTPMTNISGSEYVGDLPTVDCGTVVQYYIQGEMDGGAFIMTDPLDAPNTTFVATSLLDTVVTRFDDFNEPVTDWLVQSVDLTSGAWEQANPNVTIEPDSGDLASPDGDASQFGNGMAFVTENCLSPDPTGCSVTGGPTYLISPTLDLAGNDAQISYARWFYCSDEDVPIREDFLITEVSNDGGRNWEFVHQTGGTNQQWETASFVVGEYVEPTDSVQVRFSVENHTFSITNAAIDKFEVEELLCEEPVDCPADLAGPEGVPDGFVDVFDLLFLIGEWGTCPQEGDCPADVTGPEGVPDGVVDVFDLLELIGLWGPCD